MTQAARSPQPQPLGLENKLIMVVTSGAGKIIRHRHFRCYVFL